MFVVGLDASDGGAPQHFVWSGAIGHLKLAIYKPAGARKVVVLDVSALKIAHHVRDLIVPRSSKQ